MWTALPDTAFGANRTPSRAWQAARTSPWWSANREASLNWLAFGILLAAWNASDDDASRLGSRPEALRRYSHVSVRAATLHAEAWRAASMNR